MSYNYWCKNRLDVESCPLCDKKGNIILPENGEYSCEVDESSTLKLLGENTIFSQFSGGTKMTKEQIKADRRKRSSDHFKKEVLPTLSTTEKIHHALKNSKKK